jgi:hypothetical protein
MMNRTRLSDFWWVWQADQPHGYVCPLLMTISLWVHRWHGRPATWLSAIRLADGTFLESARVFHGNTEASCVFPRRMTNIECRFWNSRVGLWLRVRIEKGKPWTFRRLREKGETR